MRSKLDLQGGRVSLAAAEVLSLVCSIFERVGCGADASRVIGSHLVESDLRGVESHGVARVEQYVREFRSGAMNVAAEIRLRSLGENSGADLCVLREIDGDCASGIMAMDFAVSEVCKLAKNFGLAGIALRNVGHTGRLAAFAESAAEEGFVTIIIGGGDRERWRMVAPYGGRKAVLPTNPYCLGIPGGERGAVVLDFATGCLAGGWIYAARRAGALLPENCLLDRAGRRTRKPEDYFDGGAILPKGVLGYGLGLVAELLADAMLGRVEGGEAHWLVLALDVGRFRGVAEMRQAAEAILAEVRACPSDERGQAVEIPGERERSHKENAGDNLTLPQKIWDEIRAIAQELGVD